MAVDESTKQKSFSSTAYWRRRYRRGGNSGAGSYGRLAEYKADYINALVRDHDIGSVVEFGSGDGNQASLFDIDRYTGLDISKAAVRACRKRFADRPGWSFAPVGAEPAPPHDMAMSLDVLYHLIEDEIYESYMKDLFAAATRFVLIYASDKDEPTQNIHVRHRHFSDWIARNAKGWTLIDAPEHPYALTEGAGQKHNSFASFKLFQREAAT